MLSRVSSRGNTATLSLPLSSSLSSSSSPAVAASVSASMSPASLPIGGRFQLGLFCRDDCQRIMSEVYRVLKKYNFEWKVLSLYKVKARCPVGLMGNA